MCINLHTRTLSANDLQLGSSEPCLVTTMLDPRTGHVNPLTSLHGLQHHPLLPPCPPCLPSTQLTQPLLWSTTLFGPPDQSLCASFTAFHLLMNSPLHQIPPQHCYSGPHCARIVLVVFWVIECSHCTVWDSVLWSSVSFGFQQWRFLGFYLGGDHHRGV